MTNSTDGNRTTVHLETTIPQERTGGVFDVGLGLSVSELALIILPTALVAYIELTFISPALVWFFITVGGTATALYFAVDQTPWYATPTETIGKKYDYLRSRLEMPLTGEDASAVPGAAAVHPEYDALKTDNRTLFTHVTADLQNVSENDTNQWVLDAASLANGINKHIAQAEADGFDVKIHLPQTLPRDISQTDALDVAAFDDTHPEPAREYAYSQADHYIDWLAQSGVMDRTCTVVVWVDPNEVQTPMDGAGYLGHLIEIVHSLGLFTDTLTQDAQAAALDRRVESVKTAISSVASSRRLTADESVAYLREFWLDEPTSFDYSDITTSAPVPEAAYVSDSRDRDRDQGRDQDRDPTDASGTANDETGSDDEERDSASIWGRLGAIPAAVSGWVTANAGPLRRASTREARLYGPAYLNETVKTVDVNEHYVSSLWVVGWPSAPDPGFLSDALAIPGVRVDATVYVHATDYRSKLDDLATEQEWLSAMGIEKAGKQAKADDADVAASQKIILRDHMRDNGVECSEVSMIVTVRADSREKALELRNAVKTEFLGPTDIVATAADDRQLAAMKTASPTPGDAFDAASHNDTRFEMPSDTLGAMYPMAHGVRQDETGPIYGMALSRTTAPLGLLQVDRRKLSVPHRFWVGRSGSGKSFNIKDLLIEDMLREQNLRTIIVDIARGFDGVVEAFDGAKVVVGETNINPFEVHSPDQHGHGFTADLADKIDLLVDMFYLYLKENTSDPEELRPTLNEVIRKTYSEAGITNDPETHSRAKSPTMVDFFATLSYAYEHPVEFTAEGTEYEVKQTKQGAGKLLKVLKPFKPTPEGEPDGNFEWMGRESEVDLSSRVVYFDMRKFEGRPAVEKGMAMAYILSIAPEVAKQTDNYVTVVVDEAHDLFQEAAQAGRLESMVRAGRNAGLIFDFISQADEDFNEDAAKRIAKQCAISGWQDMGTMGLSDPGAFGLTEMQASQLTGGLAAGDQADADYSECLVNVDGDVYRVRKRVSEYAKAVLDYRAADHGEFDEYIHQFTSVSEANDTFDKIREQKDSTHDADNVVDGEPAPEPPREDAPTDPPSFAPKPLEVTLDDD